MHFGHQRVVAHKLLIDIGYQFHPVVVLHGCRGTRTLFLLGESLLETLHVHRPSLLGSHQLRQVDGEAVCVEQFEGKSTVNNIA